MEHWDKILDGIDAKIEINEEVSKSYEDDALTFGTAVWNNLKIIFKQQIILYMNVIEQNGKDKTITDLNRLFSFMEYTINNTLDTFLKQKITISKLKNE